MSTEIEVINRGNRRTRRMRDRVFRRKSTKKMVSKGFGWKNFFYAVAGVILGLASMSVMQNAVSTGTLAGGFGTSTTSPSGYIVTYGEIILIAIYAVLFFFTAKYAWGRYIFGIALATVIGVIIFNALQPYLAGITPEPEPEPEL